MSGLLFKFSALTTLLAAENAVADVALSPAGWAIMIVSVSVVLTLVSFCVYRVLSLPPVEIDPHLKGPLEIDTGDTENAD